jgi:peptidyl-prolyl cis-trans isomerase C
VKYFVAILAFIAIPLLAQTPPADPNKVVLQINDEKLTEADYADLVKSLPPQYQQYANGPGKRAFAEQIIQLKLLSADAEKKKLDQDPKVKAQIQFSRENALAALMFQNIQDNVKIDDAAIAKYYDAHKNDYDVVTAKHILVRVKGAPMAATPGRPELSDDEALAKAKAVRARVAGGEDFSAVAKLESDDTGSAAKGGDLGEFKRGMMVPPFEQAAFAAKVGEITEPVKSPFGYHIIKVESHTTKPMADVKAEIATKLKPELAREVVDGLRKNAKITIDDSYFGPATAAPTPLPAAPVR